MGEYGDENDGEDSPASSFVTYLAEGDILAKQGEFKKAIESFTKALEIRPTDKNCLVARSKCHLQIGDNDAALADAETSLKDTPEYTKGLFQKAEALYAKGDFEYALVFYHRGHKLRSELDEFRLGIQKAAEAIDNAIGGRDSCGWKRGATQAKTSKYLETKGAAPKHPMKPVPSGTASLNDRRTGKTTSTTANNPTAGQAVRSKAGTQASGSVDDKSSKHLLGEMYADKEYLEKLLNDHDLIQDTNSQIHSLIANGLSYLEARTEFWRQQKPMYARRNEQRRKFKKATLLKNKHDIAQARRVDLSGKPKSKSEISHMILSTLDKINKAIDDDEPELSLKHSKALLKKIGDIEIEDKHHILGNLYSNMGNAYYDLNNFQQAIVFHQRDLDMGAEHKIPASVARALGNLGRAYASIGDYTKAISLWQQKLDSKTIVPTLKEKIWLYHDIGRSHLELDATNKALEYGNLALKHSIEANDDRWLLNSHVLIAQANAKLNISKVAQESYQQALNIAQKLQDDPSIQGLIKAINDINQQIPEDSDKSKLESSDLPSNPPKSEAAPPL